MCCCLESFYKGKFGHPCMTKGVSVFGCTWVHLGLHLKCACVFIYRTSIKLCKVFCCHFPFAHAVLCLVTMNIFKTVQIVQSVAQSSNVRYVIRPNSCQIPQLLAPFMCNWVFCEFYRGSIYTICTLMHYILTQYTWEPLWSINPLTHDTLLF